MNSACEEKYTQFLTLFCKFEEYWSSILFLNLFASEIYKMHFDKTYTVLDSFTIHEVLTQIFGHVSV